MKNILLVTTVLILFISLAILFHVDKNVTPTELTESSKKTSVKDTTELIAYRIPVKKEYSDAFYNAAENMYKDTDSLYSFVRLYFDDEKSDTNNIFVFEEYINKEAFELQMKSERYKAFKDTIADMLYMSLDSCIKRGHE